MRREKVFNTRKKILTIGRHNVWERESMKNFNYDILKELRKKG